VLFSEVENDTLNQAEQICTEVQELVRNHASAPFWLTGDFNLPDISWKHNNISGNQNKTSNDKWLVVISSNRYCYQF
jgi:hypothetical protein